MATTTTVTDGLARTQRRREKFAAGRFLWSESSLKRLRSCGRVSVTETGGVGVRVTPGDSGGNVGGFSGLASCGSVWSCPRCAGKILAHRQTELASALHRHTSDGGQLAMLTLTLRHDKSQSLRELWDLLAACWRSVTSGKGWEMIKARYGAPIIEQDRYGQLRVGGLLDWVRITEATHGSNGWHVHLHVGLILPASATPSSADDLGAEIFARWRRAVERRGYRTPTHRHGFDVRFAGSDSETALADYFTKATWDHTQLAAEMTRGDWKSGKAGGRSPFQILRGAWADGDADDLDLWHEWERVSKGRRQIGWSKGARERLCELPEVTDEEIAERDEGGSDVLMLTREDWRYVARNDWRAHVLELIEADSTGAGLIDWLRSQGLAPILLT